MAARTARRRRSNIGVSARTAKRRARKTQELAVKRETAKRRQIKPETIAQARTWTRKRLRYRRAGLCEVCACQAAWGHQCGFGKINDPCAECQPIVDSLPDAGPRGSKWRKLLLRLEYMTKAEAREAGLI